VWLPAYLLVVTGLCLVSGAAVTGLAALRRARSSG
jgi:hypothetical protein